MIPEVERYQGVVLRELLLGCPRPVSIGVANVSGRVDSFSLEGAAFQVKHSAKRLSPWRFTYVLENTAELEALAQTFETVWVFLVCGEDGVVGLSLDEMRSILEPGEKGAAWIRVSRGRNSMYRVGGARGELARAKPRGVETFLEIALRGKPKGAEA